MKEMIIEMREIEGLRFGAALITEETFEEYQDDLILEEVPFEVTDVTLCGPRFDGPAEDMSLHCFIPEENQKLIVSLDAGIPAFTTNKEIMGTDFFTEAQAVHVKDYAKWSANEYYSVWRSGQKPGNERLLEVEETGSGSMIARMKIDGLFNKDNLFIVLATTLPSKETVIASIGYKNPDGSITSASFEYDDYSFLNPIVRYDGEEL